MAEENHEFRGFVRSEIKTLKDVAERNYEEHGAMYEQLTKIRETLAGLQEKLDGASQSKAARYGMYATLGAAVLMAAAALITNIF